MRKNKNSNIAGIFTILYYFVCSKKRKRNGVEKRKEIKNEDTVSSM